MGIDVDDLGELVVTGTKLAFCFPGQGSQSVGMGRELAEEFPESMAVYDLASELTGFDVARACFEGPIELLTKTEVQQPALVATSLACLRAVDNLRLQPDYVIGHSVGEYSALAAANALSTQGALGLVRTRGEATAAVAGERHGAMAAILGLEDELVAELCAGVDDVWPANYNCPGQVVVSGAHAAVDELIDKATAGGASRAVKLRVPGAFHSPLMAAAVQLLQPAVEQAAWSDPSPAFMSTVSAAVETRERLAPLLLEQLTAPVKFTQAVSGLLSEGVGVFVEIGPGDVLSGLLRRCDRSIRAISVGTPDALNTLKAELVTT